MNTYTESEILDTLDNGDFPFLGNMNVDYVRGKLMLFGDSKRWAIVFNWIVWAPGGDGPEAMVESFGNCIKGRQGFDDFDSSFGPVEFRYGDSGVTGVNIRGKSVPLPLQVEEEGVEFELLSMLAEKYKDAMVASDEEIHKRVPRDLPKLLVIEDWYHPGYDEKPSETETFQQVAKVLVSGDSKQYRPTLEANTDGRKWVLK